jgi:hypothetical protein
MSTSDYRPCSSRAVVFGVAVFAAVMMAAESVLACPTCKDTLSQNDPTALGIVQGYFWSIILMLSLPFVVLAGLSTYFYVLVCRARRLANAGATGAGVTGAGATGAGGNGISSTGTNMAAPGTSAGVEAVDPLEAVLAKSRLPRWSPTLDS